MPRGTQFKKFWRSLSAEDKEEFARRVDRSVGYLFLVAGGHRNASPELARSFQRVSQHKRFSSHGLIPSTVTRSDVFRGAV
jgi:hypothetical protein